MADVTDIDFDELDRAVNSIMSGNGKSVRPSAVTVTHDEVDPLVRTMPANVTPQTNNDVAPPQAADLQMKAQTQTAPVAATTPVVSPAESVPSATDQSARPVASPVVGSIVPARRSGQFMDVVRPAAVRGNRTTTSTASRTVSRNASTIEPLAAAHPVPNLDELDALLKSDDSDVSAPSQMAIESPFITDAKVEKRPLGSELSAAPDEETPEGASAVPVSILMPKSTDADEQDDGASDTAAEDELAEKQRRAAMPAELTPDLLSIESSSADQASAVPRDDTPVQPIASVPKATPQLVEQRPVRTPTSPVSAGAIAIQPQYQQSPAKADVDEVNSIYDTASYHQPLAHPEKRKAGWSWVVWVLGLLILGAGGGALAYYLLLQ